MTALRSRLPWGAKALLAASLLLNVGFGVMLLRPAATSEARDAQSAPVRIFERVTRDLPPQDRALLRRAIVRRAPALRAAQLHYEEAASRVLDLIAADAVDVAAVERAIAIARDARRKAPDELVAAVVEVLPQMSAEGRRKLAQRGEQRLRADESRRPRSRDPAEPLVSAEGIEPST